MIRDKYTNKYYHTPRGIISYRYNAMKERSKRWSFPFKITKGEFVGWLYRNGFVKMFKRWKSSGFNTKLAPSIDRVDPRRGYSFDNMRLVVWEYLLPLVRRVIHGHKDVFKLAIQRSDK